MGLWDQINEHWVKLVRLAEGRDEQLCRDYEVLPENHEGAVYVVMIRLMLRRLTHNQRR